VRLGGELDQHLGVVERGDQPVVARERALRAALLAQELLRALAVVPEFGVRGLFIQLRDPLAHLGEVKVAPGARPSVRAGRGNARRARGRWGPATSLRS